MMNVKEMSRFAHWMLTMSEIEAAYISKQVEPFRDDKQRVADFTARFYLDGRRVR